MMKLEVSVANSNDLSQFLRAWIPRSRRGMTNYYLSFPHVLGGNPEEKLFGNKLDTRLRGYDII